LSIDGAFFLCFIQRFEISSEDVKQYAKFIQSKTNLCSKGLERIKKLKTHFAEKINKNCEVLIKNVF